MENQTKTLDYYKRLPYTLYRSPMKDSDGKTYWIAEYVELRGCKVDGGSESDAITELYELFDEYILDCIERNCPIPEPEKIHIPVDESTILVKRFFPAPKSTVSARANVTKWASNYKETEAGMVVA
jgi:predicted RNase H-like HicB family nuclease